MNYIFSRNDSLKGKNRKAAKMRKQLAIQNVRFRKIKLKNSRKNSNLTHHYISMKKKYIPQFQQILSCI